MQIIAKVADLEISQRDVERECARLHADNKPNTFALALQHLIDSCLLFIKARQCGIDLSSEEYDEAVLELIEGEEPFGLPSSELQLLNATELEKLLHRQLVIRKYVATLCTSDSQISTHTLQELYLDKKELFQKPEMVRCSHILIQGRDANSLVKAKEIRESIHNTDDFSKCCALYSDCPSCATCGDLGWISAGKLIKEMEEIAFKLHPGEISEVFPTMYGYHILMVTDRIPAETIAFEEIEDSFKARLEQLEREFILTRHVAELREEYADRILINQERAASYQH